MRLVVFDFDGLILDTEVPEFECWDICQDGWRHFLGSLKMLLESGRGTPYELEEAAHG